jgi:Ca2+-transporting ATPase
MKRRPRSKGDSIWKGTTLFIFESPFIVTAVTVASFLYIASQGDILLAQSLTFTMMVMFEKTQAFSCRSLERPVWKELFANRWLVYTTVLTLTMHLAILYHPFLNALFHVKPLGVMEWGIAIGLALLVFAYLEVRKWLGCRTPLTAQAA